MNYTLLKFSLFAYLMIGLTTGHLLTGNIIDGYRPARSAAYSTLIDSGINQPISATQIQQAFYKTGRLKKPARLFFDQEDIIRIKKLYQQNDKITRVGYDKLLNDANELLGKPVMRYELDAAKLRITSIHAFATQLPPLVMMYKLTGETKYAKRAWAQLEQMISYPDWGADRHFLDAGIGGFDFALAYDGMFDYLTEQQKSKLRDAILKNVLLPAKTQMEAHAWWHVATHNWNGICNGGIIMAALAMYETDPKLMSQIIALAMNGLPHYINAFEPDGQSEEGLAYWAYGLTYTTLAFESIKRVLGNTIKLDDQPGFKKTGWFPMYVSGPVSSLNVGDDPIKPSRSLSLFWFAKRFNNTDLARFQYNLCLENHTVTWFDMLNYEPGVAGDHTGSNLIRPDNYISGIDIMSLRGSWDRTAIFVAMHGGKNKANHGHLDAGSFYIQGMGEVWAFGDLGSDNYTFPGYFSKETKPGYYDAPTGQKEPGRWHFYRLRAEGKNCLVINPGTYPDQDEAGEAKLINSGSNVSEGFYVSDLTSCYQRDVLDYRRGIKLNRDEQKITIQDEIKLIKPSVVWWSMHTKAVINITNGHRSAIMQIGEKKMQVDIISPSNAEFQILPASYLPGETFPLTRNSDNVDFKKLAIRIDGTGEALNVRIDFSPLTGSVTSKSSPYQYLNEWK